MRYGDMLKRLSPKVPIDKKSAPDAVHAFEPSVNGFLSWPKIIGEAPTPDTVNGEYCHSILQAARPVPREFVPASIKVGKYKLSRKWPEGLPQVMPDFYGYRFGQYFVSIDARRVLEELVPGAIEYIEVSFETPPEMKRAAAYYYINVLPQARLLDWDKAESWKWNKSIALQMLTATQGELCSSR